MFEQPLVGLGKGVCLLALDIDQPHWHAGGEDRNDDLGARRRVSGEIARVVGDIANDHRAPRDEGVAAKAQPSSAICSTPTSYGPTQR
jgi:hypothetical protein